MPETCHIKLAGRPYTASVGPVLLILFFSFSYVYVCVSACVHERGVSAEARGPGSCGNGVAGCSGSWEPNPGCLENNEASFLLSRLSTPMVSFYL